MDVLFGKNIVVRGVGTADHTRMLHQTLFWVRCVHYLLQKQEIWV